MQNEVVEKSAAQKYGGISFGFALGAVTINLLGIGLMYLAWLILGDDSFVFAFIALLLFGLSLLINLAGIVIGAVALSRKPQGKQKRFALLGTIINSTLIFIDRTQFDLIKLTTTVVNLIMCVLPIVLTLWGVVEIILYRGT